MAGVLVLNGAGSISSRSIICDTTFLGGRVCLFNGTVDDVLASVENGPHTVDEIDPGEPSNMPILLAFE